MDYTSKRLREIINEKRFSIPKLAEAIGMSYQGLRNGLKTGFFSSERLKKIAEVLEVDINDLIEPSIVKEQETEYKRSSSVDKIQMLEEQISSLKEHIETLKMQLKLREDDGKWLQKLYEELLQKKC